MHIMLQSLMHPGSFRETKNAIEVVASLWNDRSTPPQNWLVDAKTGAIVQVKEQTIRVVVMDDSPVLRALIVAMLDDLPAVDQVLQADDARTALDLVLAERPLIAILDIKVPGDAELRNGIDVLRAIKRRAPATEVIMLTNHAIPLYRSACMEAGAAYFLDKSSEFDQLPHAIEEIIRRNS